MEGHATYAVFRLKGDVLECFIIDPNGYLRKDEQKLIIRLLHSSLVREIGENSMIVRVKYPKGYFNFGDTDDTLNALKKLGIRHTKQGRIEGYCMFWQLLMFLDMICVGQERALTKDHVKRLVSDILNEPITSEDVTITQQVVLTAYLFSTLFNVLKIVESVFHTPKLRSAAGWPKDVPFPSVLNIKYKTYPVSQIVEVAKKCMIR